MNDDEIVSLYVQGELGEGEARRLEARLENEPQLAARVDEMMALIADLEALPAVAPSPPSVSTRRGSPRRWALAIAAGMVAAAVLGGLVGGALSPAPQDTVELAAVAGRHRVRGEGVELHVAGVRARVDGEAWIWVEPADGVERREGQEEDMDLSHAASAAGGALISVVVLSGGALVWSGAGSAPVAVGPEAGAVAFRGEPLGPVSARAPSARSEPTPVVTAGAELASEVERLRFENELLRGQLALHEGVPAPWPDALPEALRRDRFAAHAKDVVEGVEGLELLSVDCSEFPCLAVLTAVDPSDEEGLKEDLRAFSEGLGAPVDGPRRNLVSVARNESEAGSSVLAVLSILPGEEADAGLQERIRQRTSALEEEAREADEQAREADEDVETR